MLRNVIVTGAAGGIGRAVVKVFAEQRDNIWAVAHKYSQEFENALQDLAKKNKVWIKPVYMDLEDSQDIKSKMETIRKEKLPIDILCNIAGIGHMGLLGMTSQETINKIFQVNVLAPIQLTQIVLRSMQRQKHGYIINVTSTASEESYMGNTIYGATKAALNQFTRSLAYEVAESGIVVNAVAPGLTDTVMSHIFEGKDPQLPLERSILNAKVNPEEVALVIKNLCTNEMAAVNGQVVKVHGAAINHK